MFVFCSVWLLFIFPFPCYCIVCLLLFFSSSSYIVFVFFVLVYWTLPPGRNPIAVNNNNNNIPNIYNLIWTIVIRTQFFNHLCTLNCLVPVSIQQTMQQLSSTLLFSMLSGWRSRVSSGNTVSDYGAGRPGDRGSIPSRGKWFFLRPLCPDRLWGPPPSFPMGTGGPFPGVKRGRGVTLTTHPPSSAEVVN
jgi:hypothetical protein